MKIKKDCEKMKNPKSKIEVKSEVKIKNKPCKNDIRCFKCNLAGHKSNNIIIIKRKSNSLFSVFLIWP